MCRTSEKEDRWDTVELPSWNDATVLLLDNAIDNNNSSEMMPFEDLFASMISCDSAGCAGLGLFVVVIVELYPRY